ncbi:unnamed protein product [Brachionus calyciflorus]|uniref:Chitin-binding type-2 domain-containing protein n=1 Tax=Brachionus calyciflorus TaxID=104777 RepID=A0A814MVL3_9BILA|nr:unnamed protein product [Brachionus calyciflorus]
MKFKLMIYIGLVLFEKINSIIIYGSFCDYCDFGGDDMTNFRSSDFEDCWINTSCTLFSFLKSDNRCWLKNTVNASFNLFNHHREVMCGKVDRTKNCLAVEDLTPDCNNCTLYYRCFTGFLQHLGCLNGMYFDPILKNCTINSTCTYACKSEKDLVGIINNTNSNEFYNCMTQKIETCKSNGRFDIIKKECTHFSTSKVFKKLVTSGNYGSIGSANFNFKYLCLAWCLKDSNCKMVIFEKFLCRKYELNSGSSYLEDSLGYLQQ